MLHFIKGRAGSGKSKLLFEIINEKTATESNRLLMLIPEQFSFETDRSVLKFLGAKKHKNIDVTSFERLALSTLKDIPALKKTYTPRSAVMSQQRATASCWRADGQLWPMPREIWPHMVASIFDTPQAGFTAT